MIGLGIVVLLIAVAAAVLGAVTRERQSAALSDMGVAPGVGNSTTGR